jgi:hypothetical protein
MPQMLNEPKPRTFTFTKSGWILRVIASDVCLALLAAILVWFGIVMPVLPSQPWIRYALTIVGLVALYVLFEFMLRALVSGPIVRWMEAHNNRVLPKSSRGKEQKQATNSYPTASDVETAVEQKRA